jgi:transposase
MQSMFNVEGNLLEVMTRVGLTNEMHLAGCHADKFNDVLEWNEGVVNFSAWILLNGEWWRLLLIGFSRKSISDSYRRLNLHGPLIDRMSISRKVFHPTGSLSLHRFLTSRMPVAT